MCCSPHMCRGEVKTGRSAQASDPSLCLQCMHVAWAACERQTAKARHSGRELTPSRRGRWGRRRRQGVTEALRPVTPRRLRQLPGGDGVALRQACMRLEVLTRMD